MKNRQCSIAVGSVCLLIGMALNAILFHVGSEIVVFGFLFALRHLIRWRTAFTVVGVLMIVNMAENLQGILFFSGIAGRFLDVHAGPGLAFLPAREVAVIVAITQFILFSSALILGLIVGAGISVILGLIVRRAIKKRGILGLP